MEPIDPSKPVEAPTPIEVEAAAIVAEKEAEKVAVHEDIDRQLKAAIAEVSDEKAAKVEAAVVAAGDQSTVPVLKKRSKWGGFRCWLFLKHVPPVQANTIPLKPCERCGLQVY